VLHALDRLVPPPPVIVDYLRQERPDALLITPLVDLGSQQIDYVRAARALGIPTGLAVWSWDHLTSKAYLREPPERVLVWNETQRREAVETHRVPPDRVIVTGAQCFDRWFDRSPSRTREQFCAKLGLPPDRPIVLWVGTGLIKGSPPEPPFVREWIGWVRSSDDPVVAGASVLIRPHPTKTAGWHDINWSAHGPVAIWGGTPVDDESRADYFDSLFHSTAVVGLNTSAFIEAGIVGREVLTILAPGFHDNQDGTAHFRYLREIGGGLLRVSRDRDGHLAQLSAALRTPRSDGHRHRAFIEAFVRPKGLGHAATPDFVAAAESLPGAHVEVPRTTGLAVWRRAVLGAAVRALSWAAGEALVRSPRELDPERQARIRAARASAAADARRAWGGPRWLAPVFAMVSPGRGRRPSPEERQRLREAHRHRKHEAELRRKAARRAEADKARRREARDRRARIEAKRQQKADALARRERDRRQRARERARRAAATRRGRLRARLRERALGWLNGLTGSRAVDPGVRDGREPGGSE
jgi:hypothetical protein